MQDRTLYARPERKEKVKITYISRRSSIEWPEKKHCESGEGDVFQCHYFSHLGMRQLRRVVKNDAEVVKALKSLEREFSFVEVEDVDFNLLSFKQQIATDIDTDIMVGPHGAGLSHTLFMPDRGRLIELFIDGFLLLFLTYIDDDDLSVCVCLFFL